MPLKSINACIAQGARKRAARGCRGPVAGAGGLGLGPPHQLDLPQRSGRAAAPGTAKIGAGSAFGFFGSTSREAHRDGAARRDAAGDGPEATHAAADRRAGQYPAGREDARRLRPGATPRRRGRARRRPSTSRGPTTTTTTRRRPCRSRIPCMNTGATSSGCVKESRHRRKRLRGGERRPAAAPVAVAALELVLSTRLVQTAGHALCVRPLTH